MVRSYNITLIPLNQNMEMMCFKNIILIHMVKWGT
jgi:hypothetical protein